MHAKDDHPHWQSLLAWLATHGMDTSPDTMLVQPKKSPGAGYGLFALKSIDTETRLFSIPPNALLNITTLSPFYPQSQQLLTAIQLMSLHIFLYRPVGTRPSSDPLFGPYISTLPAEFDSHPLSWLLARKDHNPGSLYLCKLPSSVIDNLHKLAERFKTDWAVVRQYLQVTDFTGPSFPVIATALHSLRCNSSMCEERYLWAWLNVNTRCLYHRLQQPPSDKNNVTMCPILDFANHTLRPNHMSPVLPDASKAVYPPKKTVQGEFTVKSPAYALTKENDELLLTYGAHPNKTLFVEYGFVDMQSFYEDAYGEVNVQEITNCLFEAKGVVGAWMKEVLIHEGYWGDWTMHLKPTPAHPSFRLITALRLLELFPTSEIELPQNAASVLSPWKATLMGTAEIISYENEEAWRATLLRICRSIADHASRAVSSLDTGYDIKQQSWLPRMKKNIKVLWEEELCVASAVAQSIYNNEEF